MSEDKPPLGVIPKRIHDDNRIEEIFIALYKYSIQKIFIPSEWIIELKELIERKYSMKSLQSKVKPWLLKCFGLEISNDKKERNHRFLEESLELVQACGCTSSEAHQLVDYVFNRDIGEKHQEVGGVMITLAALCLANNLDMHECGEIELSRIWTCVEKIRAKQAAKPKHSPLP